MVHYKNLFPGAELIVGGVYASLMPEHCQAYTGCDRVFVGIHKEAEKYASQHHLSYHVLDNPHPIDYQIVHTSRGCFRKCSFCGAWKIEPQISHKESIKQEIRSNKLIFYDNNFLANPFVEQILSEIIEERESGNFIVCESQSGFDGTILLNQPHLAELLKKAGFVNARIAWDGPYGQWRSVERQIHVLREAGFGHRDTYVFMLYNFDIPLTEMERKRVKCWEWKVQIADCRYRPLDQTFDNYIGSRFEQTEEDYYIHPKWTDCQVRLFRRHVRRQNICIRQQVPFYSRAAESKRISKRLSSKVRGLPRSQVETIINDAWFPDEID